jgi:hypothetical protein
MKRSLNNFEINPKTKFIRYPKSGVLRGLIGVLLVLGLLIGIIFLNIFVGRSK